MGHAEWKDVLALALSIIAREPPPFQIFIWLGIAFAALMFVEGLRSSFVPRRAGRAARKGLAEAPEVRRLPEARSPTAANSPFAPRGSWTALANNRKRGVDAPRRQKFPRPNIRRMPAVIESAPEPAQAASTFANVQVLDAAPSDG